MEEKMVKKKKSFNLPLQLACQLEETAKARDTNETNVLTDILREHFQSTEDAQKTDTMFVHKERIAAEITFIRLLVSNPSTENTACYRRLRKELDRLCQIMGMPSCDG